MNAAIELARDDGINVYPDIAVSYVSTNHELEKLIPIIRRNIKERHSSNLLGYHDNSMLFNIGVVICTPSRIASISYFFYNSKNKIYS